LTALHSLHVDAASMARVLAISAAIATLAALVVVSASSVGARFVAADAGSDAVVAAFDADAAGDGAAVAVVGNDAFASRAVLATQSGTVLTSFAGASVEAGEPGDLSAGDASLWWKITASVSGSMIVAARIDDGSLAINAYTDAATLSALRALGQLWDCGGGALLPLDPSRTSFCSVFAVTAGKTYALQLIRYGSANALTMMFAVGRTWHARAVRAGPHN
jgi:hypothetical protein